MRIHLDLQRKKENIRNMLRLPRVSQNPTNGEQKMNNFMKLVVVGMCAWAILYILATNNLLSYTNFCESKGLVYSDAYSGNIYCKSFEKVCKDRGFWEDCVQLNYQTQTFTEKEYLEWAGYK